MQSMALDAAGAPTGLEAAKLHSQEYEELQQNNSDLSAALAGNAAEVRLELSLDRCK